MAHPVELRAAGYPESPSPSDAELMSSGDRLDDFDSDMFFASALGLEETYINVEVTTHQVLNLAGSTRLEPATCGVQAGVLTGRIHGATA
ncbi:MAG TPA: hypothetical protein VF432_15350 [Thermoanaerobaculia bacterium]